MSAFAALLRRLRETAGLTQEELAERAGVSARTVSDAERGLRTRIYADTAERLAHALALTGTERETFLGTAQARADLTRHPHDGLPHPLTPLLGRAADVDLLTAELDPDGPCRLMTVTGLGGTGKTRLAIAAATALRPRFAGRIRFVALATLDAEHLVDAIATALDTVPSRIAASVDRPTLLVLDAFEHVLAGAGRLSRLLEQAPGLRALVTSRVRLGIPGERELPLGPLGADDAARLFLDRARDLKPELAADPTAVADICELTSRLPLPLELAAAQVRQLPLPLLRDRLRAGLADASRVVQDAVAWSIASLSDADRDVLAGAAMFVAGCRLDALEAVCAPVSTVPVDTVPVDTAPADTAPADTAPVDTVPVDTAPPDVVPALGRLVDTSLLVLDEEGPGPRWRMLDAVREAAARVASPGGHRRRAYTDYYLGFLREAGRQLGHEEAWYQQLAAEEANVRTALVWAEADNDADVLLALATGMWLFWQARGALDEGRRWLSGGLAMSPAAKPGLRMTALWGLAWLAYHQADDETAERAGAELADLARADGNDLSRRNALTIAGMVAIARDEAHEAVALLTDAVGIARTLDNPWILATSLLNLGLAQLADQSAARARPLLGEALQHYDAIGDLRFRARCVGYLGVASLLDDEPERARALFLQSFEAFGVLGEPAGRAEALAGLAAVEAAAGEPATAATLAGAAERIRDSVAARELPLERRIAARWTQQAVERLGADAWSDAWRRGRQLEMAEVVAALGHASVTAAD